MINHNIKVLVKASKLIPILFLLFNFAYAVELVINPSSNSRVFCPNEEFTYTVTKLGGGQLPTCVWTWTINGGQIISGQNSTQITVKWSDLPGQGTLTVTSSSCTPTSDNGSTKTAKYTRHSVFGQDFPTPSAYTSTVDFPFCSPTAVYVFVDRMYVKNTGGIGEPPQKEVDYYVWTIPSGWRETISNVTGPSTVNTTVNYVSMEPLTASGGTLFVRGRVDNSCYGTGASNPKALTLRRTPVLSISAPAGYLGPRCGLTAPVTFTATSLSCATNYSWTIPSGWQGSSNTNEISVTADGSTGGTISVVVTMPLGTSSVSKDLNFINSIPNPSLSASSSEAEICHGEEWTLTCTPPSEYPTNYGFEWWTDGGLLLNGVETSQSSPLWTETNTVTLSAPSNAYGRPFISVRLSRPGCNPSNWVYIQKQVGTISSSQFDISGPSTVCPNSTESYLSTYIDPSVTDYAWDVYGVTYQSGQGTPYLGVYIPANFYSGTVILQLGNRCGYTGSPAYINLYEDPYCGWYFASPNPANSKLTITAEGKGEKKLEDVTVDLIDKNSEVVRSGKFKSNKVEFDVSELSNGQYFIQITNGDKKSVKHVVIQH